MNNGYGDWNSDGCSLTINNSVYNCSCNHTTNFAVLLVSYIKFDEVIFDSSFIDYESNLSFNLYLV